MNEDRMAHVYVMAVGDECAAKIGITANPKSRIANIQTGNRQPVSYAYVSRSLPWHFAKWIEEEAHAELAASRQTWEWFGVPPAKAVATVAALEAN